MSNYPHAPLVIDTTDASDKSAVLISAFELKSIAYEIENGIKALQDTGEALALIHYGKVSQKTAQSLARIAHGNADTWAEILTATLESLQEPLARLRSQEGK